MDVFVSDLHLGDGSATDDFHRDEEFIEFLRWTDGKAGRIIILGDLYELWQAKLAKIFWAHSGVLRALDERSKKITFVYGNHDELPFSRLTPSAYIREGVMGVHGHQFDAFNNHSNPLLSLRWPIGKYITAVVAGLEKWISPNADVWLEKMRDKFGDFMVRAALLQNKSPDRNDLDQSINTIQKLREQTLSPVTVMGHTHNAELLEMDAPVMDGFEGINKRIYANCGAWTDEEYPTFVAVTKYRVQLMDGLDYSVIKSVKRG